jgi:D-glycero-D-manno-heptose 1,7-bisphosphate phosphatase
MEGKMQENRTAVFFDRDGVLNHAVVKDGKPYPPKNAQEMVLVEKAKELLDKLRAKHFLLICVTNQPDFLRGLRTLENINEMNDKVLKAVELDDLFCCFHDNKDNCNCRQPKPGMLFEAAKKWNIDLEKSFMVGDRNVDIGAGKAAGAKTVFIDYDYVEEKPTTMDFRCKDLVEAVEYILEQDD